MDASIPYQLLRSGILAGLFKLEQFVPMMPELIKFDGFTITTPAIHYCACGLKIDENSVNCQPTPGLYVEDEAARGVHLACMVYGREAGLRWLNFLGDVWVVLYGRVLDDFLFQHTGGKLAILTFAGKDADFDRIHRWIESSSKTFFSFCEWRSLHRRH